MLTKFPFATVSRKVSDAFEYSPTEVLEERATMAWCTSVASREALESAKSVADLKLEVRVLQRPPYRGKKLQPH